MVIKIMLILIIMTINSTVLAKEKNVEVCIDYVFSSTAEIEELRNLARE